MGYLYVHPVESQNRPQISPAAKTAAKWGAGFGFLWGGLPGAVWNGLFWGAAAECFSGLQQPNYAAMNGIAPWGPYAPYTGQPFTPPQYTFPMGPYAPYYSPYTPQQAFGGQQPTEKPTKRRRTKLREDDEPPVGRKRRARKHAAMSAATSSTSTSSHRSGSSERS